ncbi:MAG: hypothetical protein ACYC4L_04655 [Chloroflexota bacterium]
MAFTYVLTESRGKVRLLIPDRVDSGHVFEDEEIDAFLTVEGASIKRAAALAIETIAVDEALTLKVIKLLHLQTNGAETARALLGRAKALREQAASEEYEAEGTFDWAEQTVDAFAARQRVINEVLRDG